MSTLLELVTSIRVDWRLVRQRLKSHPEEARQVDASGISPLQHALARPPTHALPFSVVTQLLEAFPPAVWKGLQTHTTPLHLVCRHHPSLSLIQILAAARPFVPPYDNQALLDLWKYYAQVFGSEQELYDFLMEGSREALRIYLEFMAIFQGGKILSPFHGLHTVASRTLEPRLLELTIETFSEQLGQPDQQGRLPLHCLLDHPAEKRPIPMGCVAGNLFDLQPLYEILYHAHTEAIRTRDHRGRLPLHCAVESGWFDLQPIIQHHPRALEVCNVDGWLPFQVAALSPSATLTSLYSLLRDDPKALLVQSETPPIPSINAFPNNTQTNEDLSEIHNFNTRIEESSSFNEMVQRLVNAVGEANDTIAWNSMTLLFQSLDEQSLPRAHHLAGMEMCPPGMLAVLGRYDASSFDQRDAQGRLPLHHLAAIGKSEERILHLRGDDDEETCPYEGRLQWLLETYPDSARARDASGRLPIHIAAGNMPLEGLQKLVAHWPGCLRECDRVERLPPILSGASTMKLDEIFFLLLSSPDALPDTAKGS